MKTLLSALVIIVALVLGMTITFPAHGQPVYRWKYNHTGITHQGDPLLDQYVAKALTDWGQWSAVHDGGKGMDIVVEYGAPPGWGEITATAWAVPYGGRGELFTMEQPDPTIPACAIYVDPHAVISDWDQFGRVMMHEVGHCLGLDHIEGMPNDCIMGGAIAVCNDDREGIHTLYPPPVTYRLGVPLLSFDK